MKIFKTLLISTIFVVLNYWTTFSAWGLTQESCTTGQYAQFYENTCNQCGFYDGALLYEDAPVDFWDFFNTTSNEERIFSSRSNAQVIDFGNFINDEAVTGTWVRSNWIPWIVPNNEVVVFSLQDITLNNTAGAQRDVPVGRIDFNLRIADVSSTWNVTLNSSVWQYLRGIETQSNWVYQLEANTFVWTDTGNKTIDTSTIVDHKECFVVLPAFCWDGVIDTQYGETCDPLAPGFDEDSCSIDTCTEIGTYDLALEKRLSNTTPGPFSRGDLVTFDITVTNQGTVIANDVEITDYIPDGLTLTWSSTAVQTIDSIAPNGGTQTVSISFTIDNDASGQIDNFAEISDDSGNDCDSFPDNINGNQTWETFGNGLVDNAIWTGCEPGWDEDDHDIESIFVEVYDLALIKTLSGSNNVFRRGDLVTFDITVLNEWNVTANNIEITDYIPAGLTLTWGSTAVQTINSIPAGWSGSISVSFVVDQTASGTIVNTAEISSADWDDCDSNPDSVNLDPVVNDNIFRNTCDDVNWVDEDDHDIEPITIDTSVYDLWLLKTLNTTLSTANADGRFSSGATVVFDITVTNQWTVGADNIQIIDYLPNGLTLNDPAWTVTASGATQNIWPIAAWWTWTLTISFTVDGTVTWEIDNYAEIAADDGDDCDSFPDSINDDNVINDVLESGCNLGSNDEDDHDIETIEVGVFDLALAKTLSDTTPGPFRPGDIVTFDILVTNQGDIDANDIEVTDYIPAGLTLTWGSTAVQTISSILAGGTGSVSISFEIDTTASGSISNFAEISEDNDDDCDSTADGVNGNIGGELTWSGLVDNAIWTECEPGWDEDDHDIETIEINTDVFDLALRKTFSGSTNVVSTGSIVTFNIEVFNQGQIDANNIEITDYIPTGLTLTGSEWTQSGSLATRTLSGTIVPNGTGSLDISFVVDATATGTITNTAEISADNGDDCDSTTDQIRTNDAVTDDDIGAQCINNPDDEDDHDIAIITIGVSGLNPNIEVLKFSANQADTDGNTDDSNVTNDSQRIIAGGTAIFKIVVTNNGNEDLNNVVLTDALAPACNRTDVQTQVLITAIWNNDSIFNVGESFTYNCNDTGITADYTNSITVTANWVTSTTLVTDTDTSFVDIPGGWGGGWTVQCSGISVSGNQVTCLSNLRARSYRVDCDTSTNENVFVSHDGTNLGPNVVLRQGRLEATLTCATVNNPICYVAEDQNLTSTNNSDWVTDNSCRVTWGGGGWQICGDNILQPSNNEQCDDGNRINGDGCSNSCTIETNPPGGGGGWTPGISTVPSQTGILTFPLWGELIFDIAASDIVLGDNMDVDQVIQDQPFFKNASPYEIYIDSLCLVKQSGTSLEPKASVGQNFFDLHNTHGYCEKIDKVSFPGEKILLQTPKYEFITTTEGIPGGVDFQDNIVAFTMTDINKKVYNDAYFAGQLKVRVAKPSLITTGGTAFFEDSFIANLADIADGIDGVDNDTNNFGGVVISDGSTSGDNAAVNSSDANDQARDENNDLRETVITDLSDPSSTLKAYNGNDNIFIINGTDLKTSALPDSIEKSTTFIVENANLIVDADVNYDHNVWFIVRWGNVIVNADVENMDGSYVAIPKGVVGWKINGTTQTNTQLIVNGSLYGDTKDLIAKRSYVQSADNRWISVGTIVSFGSSFFRDPAPLLGRFISEYTDSVKVAQ